MYMTDFQYDGQKLSDFDCIIASAQSAFETSVSMGSQLSFETVTNNNSFRNNIITSTYQNPLSLSFDIIKDPCKHSSDFSFSDEEIRKFMTWLNRKQYYKFKPFYDNFNFYDLYYNGTFDTIKCIYCGENVIGLTLNLLTDSPWGYGEPIVSTGDGKVSIYNDSDQVGRLYPIRFVITCNNSGTVCIYNLEDQLQRKTKIKNCVVGEVLTLDCQNKVITSNKIHEKLYNDFNYVYPSLIKTYSSTKNVFVDDLGSSMEVTYSPIRKVGVIL